MVLVFLFPLLPIRILIKLLVVITVTIVTSIITALLQWLLGYRLASPILLIVGLTALGVWLTVPVCLPFSANIPTSTSAVTT